MADSKEAFLTSELKPNADYFAPDGSEIRLLPDMKGGGLCHCTLPAGKVSAPVEHLHVEEIWYILSGNGEVWRNNAYKEQTVAVHAGVSLTIPLLAVFQFRNTGPEPLCILIATMPPWTGGQEAQKLLEYGLIHLALTLAREIKI